MDDEPPTKRDWPGASKPRKPVADARFEHVREIGRGGMGRVVEARDRQLGRIVALKESLDELPETRVRFEREVAITARLEHPSIVPLYDAGVTADGAPFYVMRKVSGSPLDQLVRRATTLDKRLLLLPHMLAVADAIAHAHQRGVIHRDLKPHNVLVGEHGETIVIDWGLAKTIEEEDVRGEAIRPSGGLATIAGAVIGTPGFMAPEQVTAGNTDERTDVYALGACLYYMLAGRTAFAGSSEDEVLTRTTRGELDPLDKLVPGLPPDLLTIVGKAMARDPGDRYLDAGGLSVDLRRFLGGQLVASHYYPPLQRIVRWVRRHRAVVGVTVAGLAIAVTIAIVLLGRVFDERERTRAALAAERARGDDLVIAQASSYLATDPTRAVATLQTLRPDSPRWPQLGPLLAEARARGIAVGYPGNGHLDFVDYAPDPNSHMIVASGAGFVRLHDLAAHTTTNIIEGTMRAYALWCGPLVVVVDRSSQQPLVYDPRTKTKEPIGWSSPILQVAAGDGVVALIDSERRVVVVEVTGLPITAKPVVVGTFTANRIFVGPSGRTLLAIGGAGAQVFRRDDTWKLAFELPYTPTTSAIHDDERIAIVRQSAGVPSEVMEYGRDGKELRRWHLGGAVTSLLYIGEKLHAVREVEALALEDNGKLVSITRVNGAIGMQGVGDWFAALETPRRIVIRGPGFRRTISSPIDLNGIAGDPRGRYLVGLGMESLLAWDMAFVLPKRTSVDWGETLAFVDANTLVGSAIDFAKGARRVERYHVATPFAIELAERLGHVPTLAEVSVLDNGLITIFDRITTRERSFNPHLWELDDVTSIAAADADSVYVAQVDGAISRIARETGERTPIAKADGPVFAMAANGDWLVAQAFSGKAIRRDKQGVVAHAAVQGANAGLLVLTDGTAYFARGRELVVWPPGGEPATAVTFPQVIASLRRVIGDRIVVQTKEGAVRLFDPATRSDRVVFNATATDAVLSLPPISRDGALVASRPSNGLSLIRLDGSDAWSIAEHVDVQAIAIAPDAKSLVLTTVSSNAPNGPWPMLRFDTTTPTPTHAWVHAATNARPPTTTRAAIEWAKLPGQ